MKPKQTALKGNTIRKMPSRKGTAFVKRNGPGYGFFSIMETRSKIVAIGKTRAHWKHAESDAIAMLKEANGNSK